MGKHIEDLEINLKSRTIVDPETNCWLHQGVNKTKGYAFAFYYYKQYAVHRLSAHLYFGYDLNDTELQVNHKQICKNKNCWNPNHIYMGSQQENMFDRKDYISTSFNSAKTHCKQGHEYTPENTYIRKDNGHRQCIACQKNRDDNRIRQDIKYKLDK